MIITEKKPVSHLIIILFTLDFDQRLQCTLTIVRKTDTIKFDLMILVQFY